MKITVRISLVAVAATFAMLCFMIHESTHHIRSTHLKIVPREKKFPFCSVPTKVRIEPPVPTAKEAPQQFIRVAIERVMMENRKRQKLFSSPLLLLPQQ
jgi:hypothetical protein